MLPSEVRTSGKGALAGKQERQGERELKRIAQLGRLWVGRHRGCNKLVPPLPESSLVRSSSGYLCLLLGGSC